MLMIFVETRFHLSLTVMFWFREKYSCVIERFLDVKVVSFISDEIFSFRAMFCVWVRYLHQ